MGRGPCTQLGDMGKGSFARLSDAWSLAEAKLNKSVAATSVGKYFKLDSRKTSFTKELRAGTATFLTMVYIISVNSAILAASGGPCNKPDDMDKCLSDIKSDYVIATAAVAMLGSFAMGCFANLPLALAPAMGTNAYFTYNMVGFRGSGPLSYNTALAAVMLEGCLFLLLSALGLRAKLARAIPRPIRISSAAGIGMFLAFTGLQPHEGLGLVGPSQSTLVTLAACAETDPATGACLAGTTMRSPTFWLGAVGFLITATCLKRGVKGSMIYGIVFVTLISWIRNTSVTIFPDTPAGDSGYEYFKKVVDFHLISATAGKISFDGFFSTKVWVPLVTLLYVDILSTTGSMYSMAEYGGFTDEKGGFEGEYRAFVVDAGSTIVSSALGTTTVTTFLESTAGLKEGGRTGVTAVTVGLCFLLSLFFAPLFTSVPPWAVGPSLVVVGAMMMAVAKEVEWGETGEAVPAFVTMIVMPLTYSISNGIIAGIGVYVAVNAVDYAVAAWGWVRKMREMMAEARNQVSAAAPPPAGAEIAAAGGGGEQV